MSQQFDSIISKIENVRLDISKLQKEIKDVRNNLVSLNSDLIKVINVDKDKANGISINIKSAHSKIIELNKNLLSALRIEDGLVLELGSTSGGHAGTVSNLNDRYPILFFPVRIETVFSKKSGNELWVRIFPDDIAVQTHEEELTEDEFEAGKQYWEIVNLSTDEIIKTNAWDVLSRSFGAQRAAWVALKSTPVNLGFTPLVFPELELKPNAWTQQPYTKIMPDAFKVYCYDYDGNVIVKETLTIPDELKLGIDPSLDPDTEMMSFDTVDGVLENDLHTNEDVKWMVDFDNAISKGMAVKVAISATQSTKGFKKILVIGVKSSLSLTASQSRLESLINNHHYTDGFALLKQGTSTNNTTTEFAGYTFNEPGNAISHKVEREDPLFNPVYIQRDKKDGQILCEALGIEFETLHHIFHSDGVDISNAMHLSTAFYSVGIGYTASELMPVFLTRADNDRELRKFYTDFVRSRGALPSIRSGTQPYGILPASVYSRMSWSDGDPGAGLHTRILDFSTSLDAHYTGALSAISVNVALKSGKSEAASKNAITQTYLDKLSQHAISTEYMQRLGVGTGYIWNNLQLASIQHGQKGNLWKNEQMTRMTEIVDAFPALGLDHADKIVQTNYLESKQVPVSSPLFAYEQFKLDEPLPAMGNSNLNLLGIFAAATFDELRDENFDRFGIPSQVIMPILNNNIAYQMIRQSLMLEAYEAACNLLNIPENDRSEKEFINIVQQFSGQQTTTMGKLTYGESRLKLMSSPYSNFATISEFLDSQAAISNPLVSNYLGAKSALKHLSATATVREIDLLFREAIDTSSFRMDTWRLALVNQRLNAIRGIREGSSSRNKGIYLGAYGWVVDVKPALLQSVITPEHNIGTVYKAKSNQGYIHAPSINQAVNGAVLRSGYVDRAHSDMNNPLSVNLSSERVRIALDILEGVKNGQEIGVLLGYEFERRLLEKNALIPAIHDQVYALRRKYSQYNHILTVAPDSIEKAKANNVVNGISLIEKYKEADGEMSVVLAGTSISSGGEVIKEEIEWIWNLLDAIGDIAMSEGMFHIIQGNPVKGGAVMEAVSKGRMIAEPDVIDTPKTGLEIPQRLTMHFNTNTSLSNGWELMTPSPRSTTEAYINKWLSELLPAPEDIFCMVTVNDVLDIQPVLISNLDLQPIDLLYLMPDELKNDDALLSLLIRKYYRAINNLDRTNSVRVEYFTQINNKYSLGELQSIFIYAKKILAKSRHLNTLDYMLPYEADGILKNYDITDFENRLQNARTELLTAKTALETVLAAPFSFEDMKEALMQLSKFGIEQTIYEYAVDEEPADQESLEAWASSVLEIANKKYMESDIPSEISLPVSGEDPTIYINNALERFKIVFGSVFVVLPLFAVRSEEQISLNSMLSAPNTLLNDHLDNDLIIDEWVSGIAKVRESVANFEILDILVNSINQDIENNRSNHALQIPYALDGTERWMAVSVDDESSNKEGRVSFGANLYNGIDFSEMQIGILIDEWMDIIPNREETTGISFHHNQPNAKAPQCLILGLTPTITGAWKWDDILDMMNETFDLALKRGLTYEHLSSTPVAQVLPMINIPFTRYGNVIGLSSSHLLTSI